LLVRTAERILQRAEEPALWFLASLLLLLNVALWCLMRRIRSNPGESLSSSRGRLPDWYDSSPLLARLAVYATPPRKVDPACYIREAVAKLGGSSADAEALVSLYWEWRYAESAPGQKLVVESQFRQLVGDLVVYSQTSAGNS
jgi:hypothetical protein